MPATLSLTGATSSNGLLLITDLGGGAVSVTPTPGPISDNDSRPFDWGLLGGGPFLLAAGDGSYKPYGIVNGNIEPDEDGLRNGPHNPYLVGPVTFTFAMTGLAGAPVVGDVVFRFGTEPARLVSEEPPGGIPEPGSLALFGLGLAGAGALALRRRIP